MKTTKPITSTIPAQLSFFWRFYQYQKERFPLFMHGLLITAFTFSAIAYTRMARGEAGFIALPDFFLTVVIAIGFFFLLRLFDEFKDQQDDAMYRPYLPVPRGLVSLKELQLLIWAIILGQLLLLILFQPVMLILYAIVVAYLLLMRQEFFVVEWLRKNHLSYLLSHMLIIPIIDLYATGTDWLVQGTNLHQGILLFFVVSFCNGIVLEIGRKIRAPHQEEKGVATYSTLYGSKKATYLWLTVLGLTFSFSLLALYVIQASILSMIILSTFALLTAIPALLFLNRSEPRFAKAIEYAAGIWTLSMYLTLGGIPMLLDLITT